MEYLVPLLSIIMINVVLSGDNALVIALASRNLLPEQQKAAMLWGSIGAIGLRIFLIFIAVTILNAPYLQMTGGVLLLWIAVKLIVEQKQHTNIIGDRNLWKAVKTIIVADVVMSLDNVIAIIGIAKGKVSLLLLGLVISIPIIIWGSRVIGDFIQRWPVVILVGAVFLGWTAGGMVVGDKQFLQLQQMYVWLGWVIPTFFAVIVLIASAFITKLNRKAKK